MVKMEENATFFAKFKHFVAECIRVVKVTKKPNSFEFKTIVKVSALGIAILGLIGFILFFLRELIV
ncbi:MAG: protein translocase SEC61 complex subunit gamma [Candidatus Woesearchaeota archaeon]|nr:protein translocase SEC61 complex subunit gamma [Candidatus Woesearchaeota archaeon]